MRPVRIALTKGRLEKAAAELFAEAGYDVSALKEKGRKLILPLGEAQAVLAKAPDVVTYVEHGVCDIGIVGKDTLMEHGGAYGEVLDLGVGRCRFALAGPKGRDFYAGFDAKRVATKYPNVARAFFDRKGMDVKIVKIEGSVELAPLLGLADAIVDIVETGTTLKENGLEIIEEVAPVSARVIVNIAGQKMRAAEIDRLVSDLRAAAEKRGIRHE